MPEWEYFSDKEMKALTLLLKAYLKDLLPALSKMQSRHSNTHNASKALSADQIVYLDVRVADSRRGNATFASTGKRRLSDKQRADIEKVFVAAGVVPLARQRGGSFCVIHFTF